MIFRDVLKEHGIAFDEKWFGYGDFYAFPTKALMERFLAEPEGLPEAIPSASMIPWRSLCARCCQTMATACRTM